MVNQTAFRQLVCEALPSLYDYERLRESPLGGWLGADPGYSGKHTLRQMLLDAIEALRPTPGTPVDASDWRTYYILRYRFVEGMRVSAVGNQLGISKRQLRYPWATDSPVRRRAISPDHFDAAPRTLRDRRHGPPGETSPDQTV